MRRQIVIESPGLNRKQPLLMSTKGEKKRRKGVGEVAGGTAAECAAVCCCCPFALMHLLILAVYRVPTGLCKKAWKKNKKRKGRLLRKKKGQENQKSGIMEIESYDYESDGGDDSGPGHENGTQEEVDLEKEMWDRFHGAGFWRSPSRRDD